MAIIACPECGKEISNKATACPHCGCPINAFVQGVIRLHWANRKGDSPRKTTIKIDGETVGIMKAGDFMNCSVTAGTHKIDMFQGKHHLLSDTVEIGSNSAEVLFAYKETTGFTHCQLKRVDIEPSQWRCTDKNIPRCPTCGSENLKKISTAKRIFSAELMGLASGAIGKTFECKKCGYRW